MRSTPAGTCPTAYAIQPPACKPTSQPTSQRGASADENERFSGNLCESTVMAELSHRISRCGEASEAGKHDGCGSDHVATAVGIRRDERNESEGRPLSSPQCRPSHVSSADCSWHAGILPLQPPPIQPDIRRREMIPAAQSDEGSPASCVRAQGASLNALARSATWCTAVSQSAIARGRVHTADRGGAQSTLRGTGAPHMAARSST
jgi:hypothetical protein